MVALATIWQPKFMAIKVRLDCWKKGMTERKTQIVFREMPKHLDSPNDIKQINNHASAIANGLRIDVIKSFGNIYQLLKKRGLLTDEITNNLLDEVDTLVDKLSSQEYERAFRLKEIGRKEGSSNKATPKFVWKQDFFDKLEKHIYDDSASGDLPSMKQTAKKLGFFNARALQRKLRYYGEEDHWRDYVQRVLKKFET